MQEVSTASDRDRCVDCQLDVTRAAESYMVEDDVWAAAGMAPDGGQLCIGCLEKHLGRTLVPEDFIDAPINESTERKSSQVVDRTGFRDPARIYWINMASAPARWEEWGIDKQFLLEHAPANLDPAWLKRVERSPEGD